MLSVMTYFLSSKTDLNSLRETYFEVLYFDIHKDIKLKEANTKNLVPHSLGDNVALSIKTVSAILLLIFFRPICPELLMYFKQLVGKLIV